MITIGILVSYLVDLGFSGSGNWRAMFAFGAIPAAAMAAGALWVLPESPAWLMNQGRIAQARQLIASVTDEARADRLIERHEQRIRQPENAQPAGWRPSRPPRCARL